MQVRYQLRHRPGLTSASGGNSSSLQHPGGCLDTPASRATRPGGGGLLDGRGREFERDDGGVLPEALERVVLAVLLVEHVHHDVAEVEQHPAPLAAPLATQ